VPDCYRNRARCNKRAVSLQTPRVPIPQRQENDPVLGNAERLTNQLRITLRHASQILDVSPFNLIESGVWSQKFGQPRNRLCMWGYRSRSRPAGRGDFREAVDRCLGKLVWPIESIGHQSVPVAWARSPMLRLAAIVRQIQSSTSDSTQPTARAPRDTGGGKEPSATRR